MPGRCQLPCWPDQTKDAKTFVELFRSATAQWPRVLVDVRRVGQTVEQFAEDLFDVAEQVATEFDGVDLWHALGYTLYGALKGYAPDRSGFRTYFRECLTVNLRRDQTRAKQKLPRRKRWNEQCEAHYIRRALRHTDNRKAYRLYDRWMKRLYHDALDRLDEQTRTVVRMKYQDKRDWADVAKTLGTTEKHVKNRFTEKAVAEAVRDAVREVVLDLPTEDVLLMTSHLHGWAKMTEGQVRNLLQGAYMVDEGVPALSEDGVLAAMGWNEENDGIPKKSSRCGR